MIKLIAIPALLTWLVLQCGSFSRPQLTETTEAEFMEMVRNGEVETYEIIQNTNRVNVYLETAAEKKYGLEKTKLHEVLGQPAPRRYLERREPDMTFAYVGDFEKQMEAYYKAKRYEKPLPYNVINEKNWR